MNKCICLSHDIVLTQSLFPLQRFRQREKFSSSQEKTSQRDTLKSKTWEGANGRRRRRRREETKKRRRREEKKRGGGYTNTDTEISYTNKQKMTWDVARCGCSHDTTEQAFVFTASKVDTESINAACLCVCVCCVHVCMHCLYLCVCVCHLLILFHWRFWIQTVGNQLDKICL